MTALTAFYDYVLPEVPGCEAELALQHIRRAAKDFYTRTRIKKVDLTGFSTVAGTATYALAGVPAGHVVSEMLRVARDGLPITPMNGEDRDSVYPGWEGKTDVPDYFYLLDSENLTLFATPDSAYAITLQASVAPSNAATTVDDWVFEQHQHTLTAGALASLLAIPKKPWTDPATAGYYAGLYRSAVPDALRKVSQGRARAALRTRAAFGLT